MFLNHNFNQRIESTILLNKPLSDWFERNQETMAYFELTHVGCLYLEDNSIASNDIKVLGRMAHAALSWLESKGSLTRAEKAEKAMLAIAEIYEAEKDDLTEAARISYAIETEEPEQANNQETGAVTLSKKM